MSCSQTWGRECARGPIKKLRTRTNSHDTRKTRNVCGCSCTSSNHRFRTRKTCKTSGEILEFGRFKHRGKLMAIDSTANKKPVDAGVMPIKRRRLPRVIVRQFFRLFIVARKRFVITRYHPQNGSTALSSLFDDQSFHPNFPQTMKNPPQNTQSMSLLSAYLSGGTERNMGLSIGRSPSFLKSDSIQESSCDASETSEPPESLRCSDGTPLHDKQRIRHLSTSSISPIHDLAASPLTSCSYKTLTKEYNMDTWRMYERIQTARSHSDKDLLSIVQEAVGRMEYDSTGDEGTDDSADISSIAYDNAVESPPEAEDIFELDL